MQLSWALSHGTSRTSLIKVARNEVDCSSMTFFQVWSRNFCRKCGLLPWHPDPTQEIVSFIDSLPRAHWNECCFTIIWSFFVIFKSLYLKKTSPHWRSGQGVFIQEEYPMKAAQKIFGRSGQIHFFFHSQVKELHSGTQFMHVGFCSTSKFSAWKPSCACRQPTCAKRHYLAVFSRPTKIATWIHSNAKKKKKKKNETHAYS